MTSPQLSPKTKDNVLRAFIALMAVAGLVSFNIWYTASAQRQADQRWCTLVTSLDDRWRALPSPAPEASKLSATLAELRRDLNCSSPGPVQTDPRPSPAPSRS